MIVVAKELVEQRDKILDEYEKNLGLPVCIAPGTEKELDDYLIMDRKSIEALSFENCTAIALRLGQYSFYIQRMQNRETSRVSFITNELKKYVADKLNSYKGYGYEEKYWQAIKGDEHATKLNNIIIFAQQRMERLQFLSNGLRNLSDLINAVKYSKRK